MPLVCYCKKCKIEIPLAEVCSVCGSKLTKATHRLSFSMVRTPHKDWMKWNGVFRIILPIWCAISMIALAGEVTFNGWQGALRLLKGSTGGFLLALLAGAFILAFLWLYLIGKENHYCFLDQKGVSVSVYVPRPTKIKLVLRGVSAKTEQNENYGAFASSRQVLWSQIKRVQIWQNQNRVLFYAPRWWLQLSLTMSPEQMSEVVQFIQTKVGKRKDVVIQYTPLQEGSDS